MCRAYAACGPDGRRIAAAIVHRDTVRFQTAMVLHENLEFVFHDGIALREGGVYRRFVAVFAPAAQIALAAALKDFRRVGLEGLLPRDDEGLFLIVYLDGAKGVFGDFGRDGGNGGDGIALVFQIFAAVGNHGLKRRSWPPLCCCQFW